MSNPDRHECPPFFILGAPRSGTTLVSAILDSHSRLAVYGESNFYLLFRPDLHRYGDLRHAANLSRFVSDVLEVIPIQLRMNAPTMDEFLEALVAPTFEGVLTTMLQLYARQQGKPRSGEKTPGHHRYLDEILDTFPDSPVIFVMRDPRDAVLSMREAFGMSLKGAVWAWNEAFLTFQRTSKHVHLVRYEELVRAPAEQSAALCAFLGEPYQPAVLRFFERKRQSWSSIPFQHRRILEPIDTRFVGRYRQLPRRDLEWIEAACAAGMETLGYEFACGKPSGEPIARPGGVNALLDRLRFYRLDRRRWRRAWVRWKIVLRVRARYLLSSQRFP